MAAVPSIIMRRTRVTAQLPLCGHCTIHNKELGLTGGSGQGEAVLQRAEEDLLLAGRHREHGLAAGRVQQHRAAAGAGAGLRAAAGQLPLVQQLAGGPPPAAAGPAGPPRPAGAEEAGEGGHHQQRAQHGHQHQGHRVAVPEGPNVNSVPI